MYSRAVPSQWKDVQFKDLRTEGASSYPLCGRRKDKLHPYQKPCRRTVYPTHRYGKSGCKAGNATLTLQKEGEYLLDLKKGESVILTAAGGNIPVINPVGGEGENYFGLK